MKDKIKQAGFKNKKECALQIGVAYITLLKWTGKPEKCPKWFSEYLDLRIKNIALREAVNAFERISV